MTVEDGHVLNIDGSGAAAGNATAAANQGIGGDADAELGLE